MKMRRLIRIHTSHDLSTLEDFLNALMGTIEDALLQSGFDPIKDYTRKDLFLLAGPVAIAAFTNNDTPLWMRTEWSKDECADQEVLP